MIKTLPLGLAEALTMTIENIAPLGTETVPLSACGGRIVASDLFSTVDSPSIDASLKDGYAVKSEEVAAASPECPVRLSLAGSVSAGEQSGASVLPGTAIRILTGAKIPAGSDAVLAEEFTETEDGAILATNDATAGRNILPRGSDVAVGQCVARQGTMLSPGLSGYLAAAGFGELPVFRQPRVAIVATGDEVVAPGNPLPDGKLYASNMVTLGAFCQRYGMHTRMTTAEDTVPAILGALTAAAEEADAVVTSGGAWTSDRDLVAKILSDMGWKKVFHRVRIGPGKAVGFGLLGQKPVFILPGGPPSNLIGFLQIALPGLLQLSGHSAPCLPTKKVRLAADLVGRDSDWTQFIFGTIDNHSDLPVFRSLSQESRLAAMAAATAVIAIPEGKKLLPKGSVIPAQLLS